MHSILQHRQDRILIRFVTPWMEAAPRGPAFSVGSATRLFAHPGLIQEGQQAHYDAPAEGQRFLLAKTVGEAAQPSIRVVLHDDGDGRRR